MTSATDQSTPREWAEDISPLCEVREIPMQHEHHEQGDASEAAIEVQGPDGVQSIPMRSNWTLRDVTRIRQLMEAAGYEQVAPTSDPKDGALFAFAPKVEPDELRQDIPGTFDLPDILPVTDAYNLARRHGLTDIHCTADGVAGRQRDAAGNTWRVSISADQREAG